MALGNQDCTNMGLLRPKWKFNPTDFFSTDFYKM